MQIPPGHHGTCMSGSPVNGCVPVSCWTDSHGQGGRDPWTLTHAKAVTRDRSGERGKDKREDAEEAHAGGRGRHETHGHVQIRWVV